MLYAWHAMVNRTVGLIRLLKPLGIFRVIMVGRVVRFYKIIRVIGVIRVILIMQPNKLIGL